VKYVHGQCEQWHNSDYCKRIPAKKLLVSSVQLIIFRNYKIWLPIGTGTSHSPKQNGKRDRYRNKWCILSIDTKKIFFNRFTYKDKKNLVHGITVKLAASISTLLSIYLSQLPWHSTAFELHRWSDSELRWNKKNTPWELLPVPEDC
jgi:hypothetical protein